MGVYLLIKLLVHNSKNENSFSWNRFNKQAKIKISSAQATTIALNEALLVVMMGILEPVLENRGCPVKDCRNFLTGVFFCLGQWSALDGSAREIRQVAKRLIKTPPVDDKRSPA